MSKLGEITIWFSLIAAVLTTASLIYGLALRRKEFIRAGHWGIRILFGLNTLAALILLAALVGRDFSILYVASYTSTDLSLLYTLTAFWGGQEGSLLLWLWLLSFFTLILLFAEKRGKLIQSTLSILTGVQAFFLLLLALPANPFRLSPMLLMEGQGLNPLLQHPQMAFHPPALFIGYATFAIPFALAISALLTDQPDVSWVERSRRWTLFAWLFLGIGIFLGALWSYDELGWGGYWAWDPVENASLLPWLTGAALMHSYTIYKKRGMFKIWTTSLAIMTFLLCILGTFITRSGIITSVHAFGESTIGAYFLWFMVLVLFASLALLFYRRRRFKGKEIRYLFSREYGFYLNNFTLILFTVIITGGTFYPVLSELLTGDQISLGASFYNRLAAPLGLAYLLLLGVCPILGWRKASLGHFGQNILYPAIFGLVGAVLLYLFWDKNFWGSAGFLVAFLVIGTILQSFVREVLACSRLKDSGFFEALWYLLKTGRSRYGGLIAHIGIALICIGIIGSSAYVAQREAWLKVGESLKVRDVSVRYEGTFEETYPDRQVFGVRLTFFENGREKGELRPHRASYFAWGREPTAEVSIGRGLWRDIFTVFMGLKEDGSAKVQVKLNPLVSWIWAGGVILFLGMAFALWPAREGERVDA
ncbi:MAG TPA: cytochrome C biogenesis protein [Actinobacteria bacterium]|nr:cytochrome C biogenesis protein [Actinomycetota bacterium]